MAFPFERAEERIPMQLAVQIAGPSESPDVETAFTENVSSRGARVISVRRWKADDRLTIASPPGDFRATARVAYCHTVRGRGFAIGIEFLEPTGRWVIGPQPA